MATKLWEKNVVPTAEIERFTVGRDRELDLYLAESDVLGSMAHITMLQSIGLLTADELQVLLAELRRILADIRAGEFTIEEGVEDVHSEVELLLTRRLGDVGKKIHSGRSRNDQVLVDLKLWTRRQLREVVELVAPTSLNSFETGICTDVFIWLFINSQAMKQLRPSNEALGFFLFWGGWGQGCTAWYMGSQLPDQGWNRVPCSGSMES